MQDDADAIALIASLSSAAFDISSLRINATFKQAALAIAVNETKERQQAGAVVRDELFRLFI